MFVSLVRYIICLFAPRFYLFVQMLACVIFIAFVSLIFVVISLIFVVISLIFVVFHSDFVVPFSVSLV